jgi:tetratricopeptide (TPR) repeat protein
MNSQMADQSLASELKFIFNLWLAWDHQRRGKYERARYRLDKALSLLSPAPHYLVAFDATLMVREERHEDARRRFRECLETLPETLNSEEKYISAFCLLWLSMYDADCPYERIEERRKNVAALSIGGLPRHFLRIGSEDQTRAIFGGRKICSPQSATRSNMAVSYGAGFNVS